MFPPFDLELLVHVHILSDVLVRARRERALDHLVFALLVMLLLLLYVSLVCALFFLAFEDNFLYYIADGSSISNSQI